MKINPENILINKGEIDKFNFFLITGNEDSLIEKIKKIFIESLKNKNYNEVIEVEKAKVGVDFFNKSTDSLFEKNKIFVCRNPKEIDIKNIENLSNNDKIIIIDKRIKTHSPIKKYFDTNSSSISTACYNMAPDFKKNIANHFFKKNNIKLEQDAFLYLIDKTENKYLIFESELEKIINFGEKKICLKDIKRLLTRRKNEDFDSIFFLLLRPSKEIVIETQSNIRAIGDSYALLQRVKFYFDLFLESNNRANAEKLLPGYLFMEKEKFLSIYGSLSKPKIALALMLIKKTELLLRKNGSHYLSITQRFLLNLKKNIN